MTYPYIIQGNNVVIVIDNKPHTISKTHITYEKVVEAIKAGDWAKVKDIVEPKQVILDFALGFVKIKGETLYWKGKEMHNAIATRMIQMLKEGFSVEPLVFFMENLMDNPSYRSVTELYGFLEKNNLPITPDGHFLAYKKVRNDFLDIHSATMDNSPGKIVEMARNEVDDVAGNTCSNGLHFCSESYLPHFGSGTSRDDRVVIVKINPRDVVSIPTDYNNAKGRACRYEVISELRVSPVDAFTSAVQETAVGSTIAPKQEYDKSGRALSMTKDAIRKREARARAKAAVPPVATFVKSGDTPFKHGYHNGYNNLAIAAIQYTGKDMFNYSEGYNKGVTHRNMGRAAEYAYTPSKPAVNTGLWPQPKGF